jgi:endonuclease YncB( thermonuclease family)
LRLKWVEVWNMTAAPRQPLSEVPRLATLAAALTLALATPAPAVGGAPAHCTVAAVADAATLALRCGRAERAIRLPSLRAPRPGGPHDGGEPFAAQSRELASAWLGGTEVELRGGLVYLGGLDVRWELLARGLASLDAAADPADRTALGPAEREARAQRRGIWSHDAWRAHQAAATEPVPLPSPPLPAPRAPLAARAAHPGQPSWEQRKAAFEAAVEELNRKAAQPAGTARPDR